MRSIVLITACEHEAAKQAASFVTADFKDAYVAYEQMSSVANVVANREQTFEFVTKLVDANVAVVAFDSVNCAAKTIKKLTPNTKVYGIQFDLDVLPSNAAHGLETLCKQRGLDWMGELLVSKETTSVCALQGKPRLGWRRRKLSEATDRLIACVRAGISVQDAVSLFGASKKQAAFAKRNLIVLH